MCEVPIPFRTAALSHFCCDPSSGNQVLSLVLVEHIFVVAWLTSFAVVPYIEMIREIDVHMLDTAAFYRVQQTEEDECTSYKGC